jgi:hypothetical protein
MRTVLDRPKLVYPVLVVLIVGFFALSAVGQGKGDSDAWIGDTGWFLFLLTVLATLVYTVIQVVRTLRRRRATVAA